jgi:lipid-A-disaccharide synthase
MKILVSALEPSSLSHLEKIKPFLNKNIKLVMPPLNGNETAIMGIVGAIKKFMFFKNLLNKMLTLANSCDKVLLMDSSGFNMALMNKLRIKYPNKHIIYYILPQAWIWRSKRIDTIGAKCDCLCSILPFEEPLYNKYKTKYNYVGHPILDDINMDTKKLKTKNKIKNDYIVFLPGSRKGEISKLIRVFKKLNKLISPSSKSYLVIPKGFNKLKIKEYYGDIREFNVSYDFINIVKNAKFAFVCSGTASLQCSILGVPYALCYKANAFDYFVGKKIFKIKNIGLANIMFEKMGKKAPYKEFLQEQCDESILYDYYKFFDTKSIKTFKTNGNILQKYLKFPSSENVAKILNQKSNKN